MDNVFYFNAEKKCDECIYDILCIYLGEKSLQDAPSFYSALEKALKSSNTLPDCIIIYLPTETIDYCNNYLKNKELYESFQNRLSKNNIFFTKSLYVAEVKVGEFELHDKFLSGLNNLEIVVTDLAEFYSCGLKKLVEENEVVHVAPAGHTFKHPSGRINKLFIQSRELASTETELQFIAKGLVTLIDNVSWNDIKTIYIDTIGIYSIVKEAAAFADCTANIESYHSYNSLTELNLPNEEYLVVISASTSGSMANELLRRGFSKEKIITLIDTEERASSHVLINLSSTELLKNLSKVDGNETDIELVGEHFSYKAKPPRPVTVGIHHRPQHLFELVKNFGKNGINGINQNVESIGKSPLLSLKPANLHSSGKFEEWLIEELSWSLSSSINTVIYSDDGASKEVATTVFDFIKKLSGETKAPCLLEWSKINRDDLKHATGIIVVAAFAGDGGRLRQISRDLREYESKIIPRHFLVGVGLPQSMESWAKLEQFLVRNATLRSYKFSVWKVLPIGPDNLRRSWVELTHLAAKADILTGSPIADFSDDEASECYSELSDCISKSQHSFFPNTNGNELKLTEGFIFFNGYFDKNIDDVTQACTLLAIASVLQTAREHSDPEKRLKPTNYQSVVIAPENFLRFNDDILQACFLRASLPSELDYSSDHHLSELMKEFLFKVFTRHKHPFGAAALEFAAALAVGKIKLKKEHSNELISNSLKNIKLESKQLAGLLLMAYSDNNA